MTTRPTLRLNALDATAAFRTDLPNIAFIGWMGAGKSTAAKFLVDHLGYRHLSFATAVRDVAERIWGPEARSDRAKLIGVGMGMRAVDPDCWVNALHPDDPYVVKLSREQGGGFQTIVPAPPIVIDDCRFPNEHTRLKESGFVFVRVIADRDLRIGRLKESGKFQNEEQLDDPSDHAIDNIPADYNVENDSYETEYLQRDVLDILEAEMKRS